MYYAISSTRPYDYICATSSVNLWTYETMNQWTYTRDWINQEEIVKKEKKAWHVLLHVSLDV